VGLDVVGGYLTEINVTSPTGVQEINKFNKVKLESQFWEMVEGLKLPRQRNFGT
jgi:glutathione synthase